MHVIQHKANKYSCSDHADQKIEHCQHLIPHPSTVHSYPFLFLKDWLLLNGNCCLDLFDRCLSKHAFLSVTIYTFLFFKKNYTNRIMFSVWLVLLNTVILRCIHVGYVSCWSLSSNPHVDIVQGVYTFTCWNIPASVQVLPIMIKAAMNTYTPVLVRLAFSWIHA